MEKGEICKNIGLSFNGVVYNWVCVAWSSAATQKFVEGKGSIGGFCNETLGDFDGGFGGYISLPGRQLRGRAD
jgi:hypothetical protein